MGWREWTGVGERRWKTAPNEHVQPPKTLWDWLQLLIVPAILIGVTFAWSALQTRSDNDRDDRRIAADRAAADEARQDATLQAYLDQMSGLILDKNLRTSRENDAATAVARTVTLTALRRLDGERKAIVLRFLYEAQLLTKETFAYLEGADLRGATLRNAQLGAANLARVNLGRANLVGANLAEANLEGSELVGANLRGGDLTAVDFRWADLTRANLAGANFNVALLGDANVKGANLASADLSEAMLRDTDLGLFVRGLDLGDFITHLPPEERNKFLYLQRQFLDSLSREELSTLNLSPAKLARIRRQAKGWRTYTPCCG